MCVHEQRDGERERSVRSRFDQSGNLQAVEGECLGLVTEVLHAEI